MRARFVHLTLAAACGSDPRVTLYVELQTDLVAAEEVSAVVTKLARPGHSPRTVERFVRPGDPLLEGIRVAELDGLAPGAHTLELSLLRADGTEVGRRPLIVTLDADQVATVVFTRDFQSVTCASEEASACLGGQCVAASCTSERPEECGDPQCEADADCLVDSPVRAARAAMGGVCSWRSLPPAGTTPGARPRPGASRASRRPSTRPPTGAATRPGGVAGRHEDPTSYGPTPVAHLGGWDSHLATLDPETGTVESVRVYGAEDDVEWWRSLQPSPDGGYLGVLLFQAAVDFGGDPPLSVGPRPGARGGPPLRRQREDVPQALARRTDGSLVLAARISGQVDFRGGPVGRVRAESLVLLGLGADGARHFSCAIPVTDAEAHDLVVDDEGRAYLAGWFSGEAEFGAAPVVSAGVRNGFLLAMDVP